MSNGFLYWQWLVFGMLLILVELFVPSFTIFWFGLAGVLVSVLLLLFPALSLSWQLFSWAMASCLFTFLWFKFFRPLMRDRTKAGISREAVVGEEGVVIRVPEEDRRGVVRFTTPILGDDEWPFICEEPLKIGEKVSVRDVSGNTLLVEKRG